jgi:NapC/NirT cytochrome c family, N-terminal region
MMRNFVSVVTRHWISLVGAVIALVAVVLMLTLVGIQMTGFRGGAYLGILTYMLLPMVFAIGLVLIPVGVWRKRKLDAEAAAHHEAVAPGLPVIDLNNEHTRSVLLASVVVGLLSLVVLAGATYKGVHEMESVAFCGTVCHTVMEPEHTAFQRSAHSKITCADCHIGAGADWFVKSKISGSWQMISVALNLYPTPVPSPVHSLRPARDTCEQCHWPTKHIGDKLQVKTKFADDETNTETKTVLVMKVGGMQGSASTGIHWHVDRGVSIRFLSDASRQHVYDIEMSTADGKKRVYKTEATPEGPTEWREMDCVDCHNRPAHTFYPADKEVNAAMEDGRIDKTLPFVKREAIRILEEGKYASLEEARAGITGELEKFYKTSYADLATSKATQISAAAKALGDIYSWNVFPKMKVTWGTHKNNLGHSEDAPGCFRCHDKKHVSAEGDKIAAKCSTCHAVLADEEENPEILQALKR